MAYTDWAILNLNDLETDHLAKHSDFLLAVYSSGSYTSHTEAEQSGGLYRVGDTLFGLGEVYTSVTGIRAAEDCLDGSHPLVIVYREQRY